MSVNMSYEDLITQMKKHTVGFNHPYFNHSEAFYNLWKFIVRIIWNDDVKLLKVMVETTSVYFVFRHLKIMTFVYMKRNEGIAIKNVLRTSLKLIRSDPDIMHYLLIDLIKYMNKDDVEELLPVGHVIPWSILRHYSCNLRDYGLSDSKQKELLSVIISRLGSVNSSPSTIINHLLHEFTRTMAISLVLTNILVSRFLSHDFMTDKILKYIIKNYKSKRCDEIFVFLVMMSNCDKKTMDSLWGRYDYDMVDVDFDFRCVLDGWTYDDVMDFRVSEKGKKARAFLFSNKPRSSSTSNPSDMLGPYTIFLS